MRSGWLAKRLGDLSELITKGTTPTSIGHSFVPEGINFVKVESISANGQFLSSKLARITADCHSALRRSQLKSGDILFSIAGALGRTALVTDDVIPANTNQALAIIRLKKSDEVLPEFVLQALSTGIVLEQIEKFKGGVAQQNLSLAQVQDFQIVIPPIPEQRRIIRILDEAFEGLARATANAEKNLKNARALFESHLDSVFVPRSESWVTHPLADCLQLITYGFTNPMPTTAIGPYMITAKNVVNGKIDYASARRTSRDAFENLLTAKSRPRIGDVLLTKDGTLGRLAVVDKDDICINQSVALLRPNGRMEPSFMRYLLMSPAYQQRMVDDADGATIKHIYITRVDKMDVGFPPSHSEQRRIVSILDVLSTETQRLESIYQQKLAALAELKKSLLHQAFSGNL